MRYMLMQVKTWISFLLFLVLSSLAKEKKVVGNDGGRVAPTHGTIMEGSPHVWNHHGRVSPISSIPETVPTFLMVPSLRVVVSEVQPAGSTFASLTPYEMLI